MHDDDNEVDSFNATEAAAVSAIEAGEEAEHVMHGADLVLVCYSLVALILIAIWAERRHVPSSLAAVLVGALLGMVLRQLGAESAPSLRSLLFFDEEMFLYVLLPPIIFEAGFSIEKRFFFNNLATILLFAVVGTLLTTFVVGQACQIAGKHRWFRMGSSSDALDFHNPHDAYTFGAIVSATDPVATLAIMGAHSVDPLMYVNTPSFASFTAALIECALRIDRRAACVCVRVLQVHPRCGRIRPQRCRRHRPRAHPSVARPGTLLLAARAEA